MTSNIGSMQHFVQGSSFFELADADLLVVGILNKVGKLDDIDTVREKTGHCAHNLVFMKHSILLLELQRGHRGKERT